MFVEIGKIQDHLVGLVAFSVWACGGSATHCWCKAPRQDAYQSATGQKGPSALEPELTACDDRPTCHLQRDPPICSHVLADTLCGNLAEEITQPIQRVS